VTFPYSPTPGPRPGPPPGGFRPGPPPETGADAEGYGDGSEADGFRAEEQPRGDSEAGQSTGHPAVDAVLRSLANTARLAPADQIAEYEAAHQVLQETLAGIDG